MARPLYLQVKSFGNSLYEVLSGPHSLSGRFAVESPFFELSCLGSHEG